MDTNHFLPTHDLEHASLYAPLPDNPRPQSDPSPSSTHRRPIKIVSTILLSTLIFSFVIISLVNPNIQQVVRKQVASSKNNNEDDHNTSKSPEKLEPPSRGVSQGVSEKRFRQVTADQPSYPWTNDMLSWQRTSFHFQPQENWMNDPNGPLFHMGWYHLFYQYNPDSAIWGNITWGHAISRDLINWLHLPFAMQPDQWYDINGVWTGSATILPDGKIVMLYTGDTDDLVQVQNLAYPANLSDPLLLNWIKYPDNPVMFPPPGIGSTDFRDPTTAWIGPDGKWRLTIGSKVNKTGISLMYRTTDFISYELLDEILHAVPGTGMWECVDFYPVSVTEANGLDTSVNGPGVKHVLKSSLDDDKHDYYALGTYDPIKDKWTPDNPELDVGIGLRLDYGKYYASKTFYDQDKKRRLLWGWIGETDSETTDLLKGWASVQSIPRTVVFDKKTGTNILQWPIKEVESLRSGSYEIDDVELKPGSLVPLKISSAAQLDIVASFEVDEEAFKGTFEADASYNCTASTGVDGSSKTYFCADQSRSSTASDVGKGVYGSDVPVLHGEKLSMRLLVDHSIVESFAQGGRTVITSRVYPTRAIYSAARVFLFNNATGVSVTASVKAWQMASANLKPFPFDQL
ncbi:Beta-fructofuranosidase [Heracleum sosnowskyi]|uniref:beta-fructofuranosidase n=1 Tax=Heracleum sosnowskyi TaxID=360622 RepID=A0AAD8N2S1_9APIA|nr:Beta-fructofuranosidase [Heracleum sosnowskyi]